MCRCEEITALISADLDGMLTPEEAEQMRAHLDSCEACSALARELRMVHDAMGSLNAPVPEGFADAVMEKIHRERALEPTVIPIAKKRRKRFYVLGALAAILALTLWGTGSLPLLPFFVASGDSTMAAAPAAKDSAGGDARSAGPMLNAAIISGGGQDDTDTDSDADAGTEAPEDALGSQQFTTAAQAPEYGAGEGALAGTNEETASAAAVVTPLDAGYLVLNALYAEDVIQNAVTEETQDTVRITVTVDGIVYTLEYTGLSEDDASFEFTLSGKDDYREVWAVAVDGSSIAEQ